jgi:superfamily I DNA/RNA helicase
MTRAKKKLFLLNSRRRSAGVTFLRKSFQLKKSPFVEAIPSDHVDVKTVYPKKKAKGSA